MASRVLSSGHMAFILGHKQIHIRLNEGRGVRVVHIMCRVNAHMCVPKKHRVCVREQPTACIHTVYRFAQTIQTRSVLVHWPAPVSSSGARTPMRLLISRCSVDVKLGSAGITSTLESESLPSESAPRAGPACARTNTGPLTPQRT